MAFSLSQPLWWLLCSLRNQGTAAQSQAQVTRLPLGQEKTCLSLPVPVLESLSFRLCISNTPGSVKPRITKALEMIASLWKVLPWQEHKTQPRRSFPSLISTGLCRQDSEGKYFLEQGQGGKNLSVFLPHISHKYWNKAGLKRKRDGYKTRGRKKTWKRNQACHTE